MTTRFFRINEVTKPNGVIGRSKLYADARAGLVEIRKIGGLSVIHEDSWIRYLEGKPMARETAGAR